MAGQNIKYVVSGDDRGLLSMLNRDERAAMAVEKSIEGIGSSVKSIAGAVGIGLGLKGLFNFGEDIIETTTKLESYKNLVKFASDTTLLAAANQQTINKAVADFKLPIMETYQEYAQLMAMVKGTPVEGAKTNAMFRDLAETLTILHLPAERVQAAIGGIGKLLEEGNLQPRYLRPLIATLPGFGMNLAREMGITMQKLNEEIAHGTMTHTSSYSLIPKVLTDMKNMYDAHLPEALKSYVAETSELRNTWIGFQEDLGNKLKPEIISFFKEFESGIGWLKQNEDGIIMYAEKIGGLIKLYAEWRVVSGALAALNSIWIATTTLESSAIGKQTIAAAGLNGEITLLNINLERLVALQEAAAASATTMLTAQEAANLAAYQQLALNKLPLNIPKASGSSFMSGLTSAALPVIVTLFAGEALAQMLPNNRFTGEGFHLFGKNGIANNQTAVGISILQLLGLDLVGDELDALKKAKDHRLKQYNSVMSAFGMPDATGIPEFSGTNGNVNKDIHGLFGFNRPNLSFGKNATGANKAKEPNNLAAANDKAVGQRVVNYNFHIKEVNGMKVGTQTFTGSQTELKDITHLLAQSLQSVMNDSQLHGND